jgi:hypothetical protein
MTVSGIATQPPNPPGVADVVGCGRYDRVLRAGDLQHLHPGRRNAAAAPGTAALIAPGF